MLTSGGVACGASASYAGPDNAKVQFAGKCTDQAGNEGTGTLELKYDATPPVVKASADREPDFRGFYDHPVKVSFIASDATSGPDACPDPVIYSGPASFQRITLDGTCTDLAGNQAKASFDLKYLLRMLVPWLARLSP